MGRLTVFLAVVVLFFHFSCGSMDFSPTNGVSSGGVTVTGTVTVPATASSSISVAQAGKSAGFSVSKAEALPPSFAVSDVTPDSGIAVLQPLEDATVTLGTCSVVNGSLSGCKFDDLSKLGASKQVEAVWKVSNGNSIITVTCLGDCSACVNGSTLALGECNSDTTLANAMMHHSADPSATSENTTDTFKTSISDGTVRPIEVYNANKSQTATTGGSAGADTTKNALFTIRKAMDACMATLSGGFSAGNLKDLLDGAAILSVCLAKDSTISSVDPSILSAVAQKAGNVAKKYFQDATTAGKWTSSTAFDAWATSMAEYDSTELDNAINNPANVRGLMDKFADQFKTTGSADAFAKMKQGGDAMGQYLEKFGSTAMTDEQKTAAYKLFENFNFASLGTDATKNQDVGTSMYNQVYSCTGSECTNIANNPSNYAGQMLTCPECLAGSDGLAVAQGRIDNGLLGADFAGMTPCNANADCTGGKTCSTLIGFCVAAGTSAAPGEPGATCAANNECKTNTCTSLKCAFPSGDFAGKGLCGAAGSGAACTLDTDCVSGSTCSSNKCLCVPLFPNSFSTDTNSVTTTTCGGSWSPLNDSTDSITSVVQSGASFTAYTSTSNFSGTITGNNWTMTSPTGSQISSNCTFNQSATYSGTVSSFGCSSYINSMSPVSESVGGSCNTLFGTAINSTCVITWGSPTCTQ